MSVRLLPSPAVLARCRRGILFSAPLVIALLQGIKTVTRRMDRSWLKLKPGDLLYTQETIVRDEQLGARYAADRVMVACGTTWRWQRSTLPSIHQPRALARMVLRVTETPRSEPIQDITEEDAKAEGMTPLAAGLPLCPCESVDVEDPGPSHLPHCLWRQPHVDPHEVGPHVAAFVCTWTDLRTKPGERWQDNPSPVRIAFERVVENP